jgi:Zn-dependent protease
MPLQIDVVFGIVILILSVVIHEVAHGVMANYLGDPTARLEGRLTLNPLKHLDPMGSIILPILLIVTHSPFLFGWAKPVPYNPYNLRRGGRFAEALVAAAGPGTNLLLAIIFGGIIRFLSAGGVPSATISLAFSAVITNVMLAIFNCIPIPPLDGSKILEAFLPRSLAFQYNRLRGILEFNPLVGFGIVMVFAILLGGPLTNAVIAIASFFSGI